jgi:hypothetical protein
MNPSSEVTQFEALYRGLYGPHFANPSSHITPESVLRQLIHPEDQGTPLMQLENIGILQQFLGELEAQLVPEAREDGASWFDIGKALGRTRQALWARYGTGAQPAPEETARIGPLPIRRARSPRPGQVQAARALYQELEDSKLALTPETLALLAHGHEAVLDRPYGATVELLQALERERARMYAERRPQEQIALVERMITEGLHAISGRTGP